jgi:phenylalanine-4-hydroxylase
MTNTPTVLLPADHPGAQDHEYLARRVHLASVSDAAGLAGRPPRVEYTAAEDEVWRTVSSALAPLHERFAVAEYNDAARRLALPTDRVPQLADVSDRLTELTGWRVAAVAGLVSTAEFFGALAERRFPATQYVRHPSVPFYTPEPDVVHELIGHANSLASPRLAALYEHAGQVGAQLTDTDELERFGRVFWFTLEFGVLRERGELRTYGAGLLSSFGEITEFRDAEIRPFDTDAMGRFTDYEISRFQDVLFAADSFAELESRFEAFLDSLTPNRH